jgi:cyclase
MALATAMVGENKPDPKRRNKIIRRVMISLGIIGVLAIIAMILVRGTTTARLLGDGILVVHTSSIFFPEGSNSLAIRVGAGVLLVDTQLPNWTSKVVDAVTREFNRPVTMVVNTHWHTDHSGGNSQLGKSAILFAHANVKSLMERPHEAFGLTGPGSHHTYAARSNAGLPDRTYESEENLAILSDGAITAVHYPKAHTDGDTVVYAFGGKVVALGDIVWPGAFPFVDLHNGGSAQGILQAIDDILARTDDSSIFVAGHRQPMSHADLLAYRDMVDATINQVKRQMDEGVDLVSIQSKGLGHQYAEYGSDVVPEATWIEMIYHSAQAD